MKIKNLTKVLLASALSMFAYTAQAAFVLEDSISCITGTPESGIALDDVTGDLGGASNCWGTYDGNDSTTDGSTA